MAGPGLLARLPASAWLRDYDRAALTDDALASVIVTIMLIPQSLAYALLAGLPAEAGLYASMLPLLAYALFGSSRVLAVGPVAVISLMTALSLRDVAEAGSAGYAAAAAMLALLSGGLLVLFGVLRLGFLANFLSHAVVSGFISASALLIALGQLRHVLGVDAPGDSFVELLERLLAGIVDTHPPTAAIGLGTIVFLMWVRSRLKPLLLGLGWAPRLAEFTTRAGPVCAVVVSTLLVATLALEEGGVAVVGAVPSGLPPLALPVGSLALAMELLPSALLISAVGFVESISVAQSLGMRRRQRVEPDQELVGLGAANVLAGVTGGFPVTGGFSRSVVNFDAGAATPMAGVFTALLMGVTALALTPLFHDLPRAVLAATIIVAVVSLVDPGAMRRALRYSRSDFAAMLVTVLGVLGVNLELGIVLGVATSLVLHLWRTSRPHVAVVGRVPGTEHFRNVERHRVQTADHMLTLRVDESLYFANARFLEDRILALVAERPGLTDLVLQCSAVNHVDGSAVDTLKSINARLFDAGVRLHLSEVKGPVHDRLQRSDLLEYLSGRVFFTQQDAFATLAGRPSPGMMPVGGDGEGI